MSCTTQKYRQVCRGGSSSSQWEDRKDELNALSQTAFQALAEVFVDKVIGKRQQSCKVTAELVAKIKAKDPNSMGELFVATTRVGKEFYDLSQALKRMDIPFLQSKQESHLKRPYEGKYEGKDSKKPKGDGASEEDIKIHCNICQKTHEGGAAQCHFKNGGGGRSSSSSSSSSSYKASNKQGKAKHYLTPGKSKTGKSTDTHDIDKLLTIECSLNKLSEESFACEYPMQIITLNNEIINVNALIDTGANSSNYLSKHLLV